MPILSHTKLHALTIAKLNLNSISLYNKTDSKQALTIILQKKCPSCPRLHETYKKIVSLEKKETARIQESPDIIKHIQAHDKTIFLNFKTLKNKPPTITLNTKQTDDFPVYISFEQTLKNNPEYKTLIKKHEDYIKSIPKNIKPKMFFDKLKKLYAKNFSSQKIKALLSSKTNNNPKIPRIIHQIWFNYPLEQQWKLWQNKNKAKHQEWEFILWNEKLIQEKFPEKLQNQKIFDEAKLMKDYATMSKIVRYEILNKFGGLYLDPDIVCYESFDILHTLCDFYAGLGRFYKSFGAINNGVIGSRPNHPIIQECIDIIKKHETKPKGFYDWTKHNLATQPLTEAVYKKAGIKNKEKNNIDTIFPRTFFDGNNVKKEFYHTQPICEASYTHIKHNPEAFCSRGVYTYTLTQKQEKS